MPKTRELIALAVAITRWCDGRITVHTDAAATRGVTREEVAEALAWSLPLMPVQRGFFRNGRWMHFQ